MMSLLVVLTRVARSCAQRLRRARRVRRSRWCYRLGNGTRIFYRGGAHAASVPDRFYRRALRELAAADTAKIGTRTNGTRTNGTADTAAALTGLALQQALKARLAERGIAARIRRHGIRLLVIAGALSLPSLIVLGAIPSVRRAVFSVDLAEGKPWTATSAWADFPKQGLMSVAASPIALLHTVEGASPSVTVDLGTIQVIHEVRIDNRLDCCRERAQPLAVEVSRDGTAWGRVGYRRAEFRSWSTEFPPTRARYVRARIDRTSILHLRRIRVY